MEGIRDWLTVKIENTECLYHTTYFVIDTSRVTKGEKKTLLLGVIFWFYLLWYLCTVCCIVLDELILCIHICLKIRLFILYLLL